MPAYIAKHYSKVQAVGYHFPTNVPSKLGDKYTAINSPIYPIVPNNDTDLTNDALNRLKLLAKIVYFAKTKVDQNNNGTDDNSTLKVFMAPEFFRPYQSVSPADARAYPLKTMEAIVKALRGMFVNDAYKNWLIMPGSIVWLTTNKQIFSQPQYASMIRLYNQLSNNLPDVKATHQEEEAEIVRNSTVAVKGGHSEAPWTMAHKIHYAPGDLKYNDSDNPLVQKKSPALHQIVGCYADRKSSIKKFDNLTIGLDICNDHGLVVHTLKKTNWDWAKKNNQTNFPSIDLHLLVSGGIDIQPTSVVAASGKYIFRMDGDIERPLPSFQIGKVKTQRPKDILKVKEAIDKAEKGKVAEYFNEHYKDAATEVTMLNEKADYSEDIVKPTELDTDHKFLFDNKADIKPSKFQKLVITDVMSL